ncbi:MAG TPA: hypothetical protein VGV69_10470 [Solirubrobacterales bacterium]|nr:hypothetical protein [Solirubrobacterales bacterium]
MPSAPKPPPERPKTLSKLDFERQQMVNWFSPRVLADAALRVVLSSVFGQYADKRDFQAALDPGLAIPHTYGPEHEVDGALWLDFVADLGDGFDSTYAVACLLARPQLEVSDGDGPPQVLPRGRVLVMGGDEVYPVATREEYEDRFRGPYAMALPASSDPAPPLFAIPGNHDWYDGLTNFLRFFCAKREIGAWQTKQKRSYFALELPHRWWLLAIDIQLDTYIDEPQLEYFRRVGLKAGDRVILVTGKPSWVKVDDPKKPPDSYKNLQYFTNEVVSAAGAEVCVTLSGDLHHYFHYRSEEREHDFVTSGGGGAYLYPTHTTPESRELPEGTYKKTDASFPSPEESKRLTWGALKMPLLACDLCIAIGVFYAIFAAAVFAQPSADWTVVGVATGLTMLLSLIAFADGDPKPLRWVFGTIHAVAHMALAAAVATLFTEIGWTLLPLLAVAWLGGFLLGGVLFGLYLIVSHRWAPRHANDVLACQGIPDYKNFLRLRLDEDGLTIFPLGVRRVPREWETDPDGRPEDPCLRPVDRELEVELIEPPFRVHGPAAN